MENVVEHWRVYGGEAVQDGVRVGGRTEVDQ